MVLIILFLLGAAVGSFLNVLIDRIPAGKPLIIDRSHCDRCKHTLSWYDLVPIFSWILLKAKCRYCKATISAQYPIIETVTGFLFILGYLYPIPTLPYPYSPFITLFLFSILLALLVTDLKYYLLPDKLMNPLLALSLVMLFTLQRVSLLNHLLSSLLAAGFFVLLIIIDRKSTRLNSSHIPLSRMPSSA